jgi:8-oxo-dGTP pyrophosphatase MutT (NUDIX family)
MTNNIWRKDIDKKIVHEGFLRVELNKSKSPSWKVVPRYLFSMWDGISVIVIPTDWNNVYLVKQIRYWTKSESYEFVSWWFDSDKDSSFEDSAKRELSEELWLYSTKMRYLEWDIEVYNSASPDIAKVFVAEWVKEETNKLSSDEYENISLVKISIKEFEKMIKRWEIRDSFTLASWTKYKLYKSE